MLLSLEKTQVWTTLFDFDSHLGRADADDGRLDNHDVSGGRSGDFQHKNKSFSRLFLWMWTNAVLDRHWSVEDSRDIVKSVFDVLSIM